MIPHGPRAIVRGARGAMSGDRRLSVAAGEGRDAGAAGRPVTLTATEYEVLRVLSRNAVDQSAGMIDG